MSASEKQIEVLTKKVDYLVKMVSELRKKELKETWVKVSMVQQYTIWKDKEKLRRAKVQGLIQQRRGNNGIEYRLDNVNPIFLTVTL